MPIYEYECTEHGTFEVTRSVAEVREPALCPECDVAGRRLLSAPHLACVSNSNRRARDINERSAHEPRQVSFPRAPVSDAPGRLRSSPSSRPWVLEHS